MAVWRDPFVQLRAPLIFDLRMDPFERAETDSNNYNVWWEEMAQIVGVSSQEVIGQMVGTFQEFPPRQRPASFSVDQVMEGMRRMGSAGRQ
jgi:arylsulfatase